MTTPLGDRRLYLGASDAAVVMGVSTRKTPLALWMEKTANEPIPDIETEDTLRGHLSEPVIAGLLAHAGCPVTMGGEFAVPGRPIVVHPDAVSDGGARVHEMKTPRMFTAEWGEAGSDEVPMEHIVQLHAQVAAMRKHGAAGAPDHEVAALCGEFRRYKIEYSPSLGQTVLDAMARWWDEFVVPKKRPPATNFGDLTSLPAAPEASLTLSDDEMRHLVMAEAVGRLRRAATKYERALRSRLAMPISACGSIPKLLLHGTAAVASLARVETAGRIDTDRLLSDHPELASTIQAYRKPGSAHVRFYSRKAIKDAADKLAISEAAAEISKSALSLGVGDDEEDDE